MICWFKLSAEVGVEIAMIVATAYENWNVFMIMDFSALIVINYIDVYYCSTIENDLTEKISTRENCMTKTEKQFKSDNYNFWQKLSFFGITWFVRFYKIVYYHFFPIIGLWFTFYFVD